MVMEESKLDKLIKLTKENNEILRGMRSHQRWATFAAILYWLFIIGIALGAFYFVQPYIVVVIESYNSMVESVNKVKEVGESIPKMPDFGGFFGGE